MIRFKFSATNVTRLTNNFWLIGDDDWGGNGVKIHKVSFYGEGGEPK